MAKLLNIGCGNKKIDGFINTDKEMDVTLPWPHEDETVDGIVSMQVLQQLYWRDLMVALKESYRVLKKGGVMRFGTMLIEHNTAEQCLGWKNINLFSLDLLKRVLEDVGFGLVRIAEYQDSDLDILATADNRPFNKGTSYLECTKL